MIAVVRYFAFHNDERLHQVLGRPAPQARCMASPAALGSTWGSFRASSGNSVTDLSRDTPMFV